ncbi:ATP synthase mitochondrial F1 complex assembly factor 2-like [Limulus polyphemus]|uniref:ATP synthase mitochondrial F1 complex assembly factor 2-like n=1 Tax=Limulus polyphemus TaxID=6850 RepID=A0ABM1BYU2_LIMPO|nr:ATP synthase mitochondrial F1 complex assembly factor 2-like [Limulus polyphemus]
MVGVGLKYIFVAGLGNKNTNIKNASLFENQLLIYFKESRRFLPAVPKRFYKNVSISQINGKYEVNLDQKKLKTPLGRVFQVPNETLALAVANEWDAQKEKIQPHTMNITGLCCTALDNPTKKTKEKFVSEVLEFLDTDTLCYRVNEPAELEQLQKEKWDPVISWFQQRYQVEMKVSDSLLAPVIPQQTKETLQKHLFSFSDYALLGVSFAVENLKSLVLTLSLVDRFLDVETAVSLSRLEVEFQTDQWGRLEWAHDLEQMQVQSKVAAAVLFVHFNSESTEYLTKCMKR